MNIKKAIKAADEAYIRYRHSCDDLSEEAQKYIDWDDNVSCEHLPADGLCVLATLPDDYLSHDMPECVCPADLFFDTVEKKEKISPQEFKAICI